MVCNYVVSEKSRILLQVSRNDQVTSDHGQLLFFTVRLVKRSDTCTYMYGEQLLEIIYF